MQARNVEHVSRPYLEMPGTSLHSSSPAGWAVVGFDEGLYERVRELVEAEADGEKRMFGGVGWMVHGNLLVGIMDDALIARVGPDAQEAALAEPGARPFDFTGRPMKGWVFVDGEAVAEDEDLARWVDRCRTFNRTLPPK